MRGCPSIGITFPESATEEIEDGRSSMDMEDGGWRMEDGGWRMEDGRWRIEDGRQRMEDCGRVGH
jgi:hypothetical protein